MKYTYKINSKYKNFIESNFKKIKINSLNFEENLDCDLLIYKSNELQNFDFIMFLKSLSYDYSFEDEKFIVTFRKNENGELILKNLLDLNGNFKSHKTKENYKELTLNAFAKITSSFLNFLKSLIKQNNINDPYIKLLLGYFSVDQVIGLTSMDMMESKINRTHKQSNYEHNGCTLKTGEENLNVMLDKTPTIRRNELMGDFIHDDEILESNLGCSFKNIILICPENMEYFLSSTGIRANIETLIYLQLAHQLGLASFYKISKNQKDHYRANWFSSFVSFGTLDFELGEILKNQLPIYQECLYISDMKYDNNYIEKLSHILY